MYLIASYEPVRQRKAVCEEPDRHTAVVGGSAIAIATQVAVQHTPGMLGGAENGEDQTCSNLRICDPAYLSIP